MIVIYAEKQDMGIKYAAALGGIVYNGRKIYTEELPLYQTVIKKEIANKQGYIITNYEGEQYVVTWGWGHFGKLKDVKDYGVDFKSWNDIPLPFFPKKFEVKLIEDNNPDPKLRDFFQKRNLRQFKIVSKLFNSPECEFIINGTDWEREGELIFAYVYDLSGAKKTYKRLRSNAKTQNQIRKDFSNLASQEENYPYVLAARARSIADWVVGINMTIAATKYLSPDRSMINVGRVLTPTLTLIVNREHEIINFVPTTSYGTKGIFTLDNGEIYEGKLDREEYYSKKEDAESLVSALSDVGNVISVERKREYKKPPLMHNTQTLQVEANNLYSFTLDKTLKIAQTLYEEGYITYPRVDSQYLTEDKKSEMPALLTLLNTYKPYSGKKMITNFNMPDRYFNNQKVEGHDAIIITEVLPDSLKDDEAKIYDLIARRMIMAVSPDAEIEKVSILTGVQNKTTRENELFKTTGSLYKKLGFLAFQPGEREMSDANIPDRVFEGDNVLANLDVLEQTTTPPSRYTEGTLIKAMENCGRKVEDEKAKEYLKKSKGIGRPATRAAIMERLVSASFVARKGKQLYATEKGINTVKYITVDEIKSPILTANWEAELDEIEQANPREAVEALKIFIGDVKRKTKDWCDEMKANPVEKVSNSDKNGTGIRCPVCGSEIIKGQSYKGKEANYYCSGYKDGCKFRVPTKKNGKIITKTILKDLAEKGETKLISGFEGAKGNFSAYLVLSDSYICNNCGAVQTYGDKCYVSGCNGTLSKDDSGRKLVAFRFQTQR